MFHIVNLLLFRPIDINACKSVSPHGKLSVSIYEGNHCLYYSNR